MAWQRFFSGSHASFSQGVGYFLLGMLFFSGMNVAIRNVATTLDPLQMVFLRNAFSALLLLPFALYHGVASLKTSRFGRHFVRAFVGLCAMESWFYALTHLPVNTATALSFTAPLFSTLFAVLFLGERIGWKRFFAVLMGFAGVLVVINPFAQGAWNPYMVVVLISAALMAVAGILVKTLTHTEAGWKIVLYVSALMSLMSLPLAVTVWQWPTLQDAAALFLVAALGTTAQLCLVRALALETIVVLVPFEFTRLLFTAALAWLVLGEGITLPTLAGGAIIIASVAIIAWRDAVKKRHTQLSEVIA
jgi:drug/metabolite transporter (DMT)-like permease